MAWPNRCLRCNNVPTMPDNRSDSRQGTGYTGGVRAVRAAFWLIAVAVAVVWGEAAAYGFKGSICVAPGRGDCRTSQWWFPGSAIKGWFPIVVVVLLSGSLLLTIVARRHNGRRS